MLYIYVYIYVYIIIYHAGPSFRAHEYSATLTKTAGALGLLLGVSVCGCLPVARAMMPASRRLNRAAAVLFLGLAAGHAPTDSAVSVNSGGRSLRRSYPKGPKYPDMEYIWLLY